MTTTTATRTKTTTTKTTRGRDDDNRPYRDNPLSPKRNPSSYHMTRPNENIPSSLLTAGLSQTNNFAFSNLGPVRHRAYNSLPYSITVRHHHIMFFSLSHSFFLQFFSHRHKKSRELSFSPIFHGGHDEINILDATKFIGNTSRNRPRDPVHGHTTVQVHESKCIAGDTNPNRLLC